MDMDWRTKLKSAQRPTTAPVSGNGPIVPPVQARRAAEIEPGDVVEDDENPLRGVWGADPDSWLDELRGRWAERSS
jgi:hypothetical protein